MRCSRTKLDGHLLGSAVLPALAGALLLFIATGLWADPPDSTKLALREGLFVPRDTTHRAPSPASRRALERLNRNSSKKWNVQWDRITGLPGIGDGVTKKKYADDPADVASALVKDYKDLFLGIDDPKLTAHYSFRVSKIFSKKRYTVVHLDQFYKGVKVYQGGLAVWISDEPWLNEVNNRINLIDLDVLSPLLTKAEIEEMISRAAAPKRVLKPSQIGEVVPHRETAKSTWEKYDDLELVIYPSSPPRLAYVGRRIIGDLPFWRLIIDANTGEFISARALQYVTPRVSPPRQSVPDSSADSTDEGSVEGKVLPPPPGLQNPGKAFPLPERDRPPPNDLHPPDSSNSPPQNMTSPHNQRVYHPGRESPGAARLPGRLDPQNCCYFDGIDFFPGGSDSDGGVNPVDVVHYVNMVYKNITPFPCDDPCQL